MRKNKLNSSDFQKEQSHISLSSGEAVSMLRKLKNWTQGDLASASGIAVTNISNIENDHVSLGKHRVVTLAKALGVHPAVLMFPDVSWTSAA